MKLYLKLFALVFVIDMLLGFSMSYIVVNNAEPNFIFKVIDEIISFPISQWNRLVPDHGIYRATSNMFWTVIVFNALCQALVVFGMVKLFRKGKKSK